MLYLPHLFKPHYTAGVPGKYGKLDAKRPNMGDLNSYGPLPTPPLSVRNDKLVHPNLLDMDGNDEYGDCTIAGIANSVPLWNMIDLLIGSKTTVPIPTKVQSVTQYFELEGSPNGVPNSALDNGLCLSDVLAAARTTGLFDGTLKLPYYAPVTPTNTKLIKQAVDGYGSAYAGWQLPRSAETQMSQGKPFTVVKNSPIVGGHCMPIWGYSPSWVYVYTWDRIVPVSWRFVTTYCDEAYAIIPQGYVTAGRGPLPNESLAALEADLSQL